MWRGLFGEIMKNYTFYDADGNVLRKPGKHVAFLDQATGLTWGSQLLDFEGNWAECLDAAKKTKLCGVRNWRAPTVEEQFARMDRSRFAPALNPILFPNMPSSGWLWTSSRDAEYPQDGAWYVGLGSGRAFRGYRDYQGRVLVVRSAPLPRQ